MVRRVPAGVVRVLDRRNSGASGPHHGAVKTRSEVRRATIRFSQEN